MKNIFKIHPLFYLTSIICIFTGLFKDLLIITIIIFIHELGHISGALYYKWKIDRVVLLPFGGITIFDEKINRPIKEEFVILILGPLFQIIFFYIINILNLDNPLFIFYHYALLLFNLLPIIPLDGSKLLSLFLEKIFPFFKSNLYLNFISIIMSIMFLIYITLKHEFILMIIIFYFYFKNLQEINKYKFKCNKFLVERYLYEFNFKKIKLINGLDFSKMKRDYRHFFKIDNVYKTEKEIIKKYFDKL